MGSDRNRGVLAGTPALGLPVCSGVAAFAPGPSSLPIATSYIPPQAWAAGVPGYDALQGQYLALGRPLQRFCHLAGCGCPPRTAASSAAAIQKLASQPVSRDLPRSGLHQGSAALPAGLQQGGLAGLGGFPAAESREPPLLDIAPLSTMPPTSPAAT